MNGSDEQVKVLLPPSALTPVVVCAIVRRLRVDAAMRISSIHANPYASINLVRQGTIRAGGGAQLPAAFFTGPLSRPLETRVESDLLSLSVIVQPWALEPLTGAPLPAVVDQVVPLPARRVSAGRDALRWLDRDRAGSAADDELWPALRRLLRPALSARPPQLGLAMLRTEGVVAAARACGLSERQYRRRFVAHMGLRPAAWVRLVRLEFVFGGMVAQPPALSRLAIDAGYADQAHLSRDARALLGRSPKSLQQRLHRGDVDWPLKAVRPIFSRLAREADLPSRHELP